MRDLFKKLGSLALGVGALSLVLVNAAMTHGCASSSATQQATPQAGLPPNETEPPPNEAPPSPLKPNAVAGKPAANPNCEVPSYMYATKAPIWLPPECHGGTPAPTPAQAQKPNPAANAVQQAP
jgi:hypothetical protein